MRLLNSRRARQHEHRRPRRDEVQRRGRKLKGTKKVMQRRRRTRATTTMIEFDGLLCSSHRHFHIPVFAQQQTLLQYSHRSQTLGESDIMSLVRYTSHRIHPLVSQTTCSTQSVNTTPSLPRRSCYKCIYDDRNDVTHTSIRPSCTPTVLPLAGVPVPLAAEAPRHTSASSLPSALASPAAGSLSSSSSRLNRPAKPSDSSCSSARTCEYPFLFLLCRQDPHDGPAASASPDRRPNSLRLGRDNEGRERGRGNWSRPRRLR